MDSQEKVLNTIDDLSFSETKSLNIAVLGFASGLLGYWDPSNTTKGIPGSEECAVYATQELANRGHKVTVYMNPPKDSPWQFKTINPRWLSVIMWDSGENKESYDLVLMWRRLDVSSGRKRGKVVIFWPHDSYYGQQFPSFDGAFVLSNHHRSQLNRAAGFSTIPYTISGNGFLLEQFNKPASFSNPFSIGYFSNYSRGLEILIGMWPVIKKLFPEAILNICYGREHWNTMSEERLNELVKRIESYKSLGVIEYGKLGHLELAEVMQNTSVWSYPCTDSGETFCITAVKCQAAGCIPVTTRMGALNETVHPDAPSINLITNVLDAFEYEQLLVKTLERVRDSIPEELSKERKKYQTFSEKFSWKHCVDKWLELYSRLAVVD